MRLGSAVSARFPRSRSRSSRQRLRTDPAIPTINVVFLLLLFFLLAGTIAAPVESDIDPARVGNEASGRLPRPLMTISRDGDMHLDGRAVPPEELAAAVEALGEQKGGGSPTIFVLAARDLPADRLLALLAAASSAGAGTSLVAINAGTGAGSP